MLQLEKNFHPWLVELLYILDKKTLLQEEEQFGFIQWTCMYILVFINMLFRYLSVFHVPRSGAHPVS